jgi:hypothetical protein
MAMNPEYYQHEMDELREMYAEQYRRYQDAIALVDSQAREIGELKRVLAQCRQFFKEIEALIG